MNKCINCQKETTNPKFCTRNCSAIFNNKLNPKRKPEGKCKTCQTPIKSDYTYCSICYKKTLFDTEQTYLEVTSLRNYQKNSRIRNLARAAYRKSDKPKFCIVCGYDKHYEICHIKAINSFSPQTKIKEINDITNLIALCPNHHWELDNGLLQYPLQDLNSHVSN